MEISNKNIYKKHFLISSSIPASLGKDGSNPHFNSNYTTLDGINVVLKPLLKEHRAALLDTMELIGDNFYLKTTLIDYESGETLSVKTLMDMSTFKNNKAQSMGSMQTYFERYNRKMLFNISSGEDDDGNAVSDAACFNKQDNKFI